MAVLLTPPTIKKFPTALIPPFNLRPTEKAVRESFICMFKRNNLKTPQSFKNAYDEKNLKFQKLQENQMYIYFFGKKI